jgi:hypothetical protein
MQQDLVTFTRYTGTNKFDSEPFYLQLLEKDLIHRLSIFSTSGRIKNENFAPFDRMLIA